MLKLSNEVGDTKPLMPPVLHVLGAFFWSDNIMETTTFPVPVLTSGLLLTRPGMALLVDLPLADEEIWITLMADAGQEGEDAPAAGYLLLRKRLTQRPGLTTYAAVEARPAHDPPPNPATFRTIFPPPGPGVYAERLRLANALGA